ncbi:MAG: EI24 domain-containing protein [Desulfobacterales bacterium]
MGFFHGISYNFRGFLLSLKSPRLLMLGLLRFMAAIVLTVGAMSLILAYHTEIMELIWSQPDSRWLIWLWHLLSWVLTLVLMAMAAVVAYLLAQVLFAVFIMDVMSRITERQMTGVLQAPASGSAFSQFIYLVKQEIPRAIIPVAASLTLMAISWLTPAGPVMTLVTPLAAGAFLAWDNTDLVPARRLVPFKDRFRMFYRELPFHLGFGLLFLVPVVNLVFLSFAPVGATLYITQKRDAP